MTNKRLTGIFKIILAGAWGERQKHGETRTERGCIICGIKKDCLKWKSPK